MKLNNHVILALITAFLGMWNTLGAMEQITTQITPEQQYVLNYADYRKTIELWRNKTIHVQKATLPKLIIHSDPNDHKVVSQKTTKIFCKASCFDFVSNCFCVQRSYWLDRTINTRGWNESEIIRSTQPQNDRFDILNNITEPINCIQEAPCLIAETFKKGLEAEIVELCKEQEPSARGTYNIIWNPDYSQIAFVVIGKTEGSDDFIFIMKPICGKPISKMPDTNVSFNFE